MYYSLIRGLRRFFIFLGAGRIRDTFPRRGPKSFEIDGQKRLKEEINVLMYRSLVGGKGSVKKVPRIVHTNIARIVT